MTESETRDIVSRIRSDLLEFKIKVKNDLTELPHCIYLQGHYREPNENTGATPLQKTRKWPLWPSMTESEIVHTALLCLLQSMEKRGRESFKYKGRPVFGSHVDAQSKPYGIETEACEDISGRDKKEMKNKGLHSHRVCDNPRETAFANRWKIENNTYKTLQGLLCGTKVEERDITVAATVVQWLGSDVGMAFLGEVIKSSPEVRQCLDNR